MVDDDDFEKLAAIKWTVLKMKNNCYYAVKCIYVGNNKSTLLSMHRLIMNATDREIQVDHIDGNTLNNQKSNLRLCTGVQNRLNRGKTVQNTSGYKGVFRSGKTRWRAQIGWKGKKLFLGSFETKEEAAQMYNLKAVELFGEFANLNKI